MIIYWQDKAVTIYNSDCRNMHELADELVQMVCTSPPYWGLRKYSGLPDLIWGDEKCVHRWESKDKVIPEMDYSFWKTGGIKRSNGTGDIAESGFCSLCGAWKGQFGLEPTIGMYVSHTIEILREIRRVLRKDGVVFWNIGDSYYNLPPYSHSIGSLNSPARNPVRSSIRKLPKHNVLKLKDLCLIPFRVTIAAQEDGWWVRSVIIWNKPNPMPESVTDRPTESHEYILMLTKSGTTQYWTHRDGNREAPNPDYRWVKGTTPPTSEYLNEIKMSNPFLGEGQAQVRENHDIHYPSKTIEERDTPPEGWTPKNKMGWNRINLWRGHDYFWDAEAVREPQSPLTLEVHKEGKRYPSQSIDSKRESIGEVSRMRDAYTYVLPSGRNLRSVWTFPTQPYKGAHFATFPEKLVEICVKAATPEMGCCSKCGAPWVRITQTDYIPAGGRGKEKTLTEEARLSGQAPGPQGYKYGRANRVDTTLGWQPTCKCNTKTVPSIVLDPFLGSGTTLWVAKKLGRHAVGYDLSIEYAKLARDRCKQQVLDFVSTPASINSNNVLTKSNREPSLFEE